MDLQLQGQRALVTGSSKGIGRGAAQALAEEGCNVLLASRDGQALEAAAREIQAKSGRKALWKAIDLGQRGAAESLADWAGEIDILVNNAGAIPGGDVFTVDEDTWRRTWDLKVFGYINLTRAVYARMKAMRRGVIINILGNFGERVNAASIAVSSANAGLAGFTRALGGASHADGVRVLAISPGPVATDRLFNVYKQMAQAKLGDPNRYPELFGTLPFGRPATVEEITAAVAFFASPKSAYTTGVIVTIDGGIVSSS
ncbi:MAG: SDR family oxidoreductase [Burkholderiales bacterium]|nr:SDR family oxidoreductase [Burkholderiales bacterium]